MSVVVTITLLSACSKSPGSVNQSGVNLRFGKLTERTLKSGADGRNATAAVTGMNQFSVDLFNAVAMDTAGNVVVGSYSVVFVVSMLYAGARGGTADEIADVLHSTGRPEAWHEGINAYDLTLLTRTAGSPTTWTAANKVWASPGISLRDEFLDVLTGSYGSPLATADFAGDSDGQRRMINEWVANNTKQRIPELFVEGALPPSTQLALVNAVALDAPWEFPFDPARTGPAPFRRLDGTEVAVPMMHYEEYLPSGRGEDFTAVELPYAGGTFSMVIIVPTDFERFQRDLSAQKIDQVTDSIQEQGIHLTMPKWSSRTKSELNKPLSRLGMPTAFAGSADFSGMSETSGLSVSAVRHEAFIEVDEAGTRAAAATGGEMLLSHGPTISINQPFLYLVRDRGAGTILFMGRVTDPSIAP
jgi:serpin B